MPAKRTTMRQVREIVRLHQAGISTREIGIRVGVAAAGMVEGIPAEQTDAAVEKLLFTGSVCGAVKLLLCGSTRSIGPGEPSGSFG